MKKWFITLLMTVVISVSASIAHADAIAKLFWNANTENDLAGYKIYYGDSTGNYTTVIDVENVTTYTISNLAEGKLYYFVATAYDTSDNESGYSSEVELLTPIVPPDAPEGFQAEVVVVFKFNMK